MTRKSGTFPPIYVFCLNFYDYQDYCRVHKLGMKRVIGIYDKSHVFKLQGIRKFVAASTDGFPMNRDYHLLTEAALERDITLINNWFPGKEDEEYFNGID